MIRMADADRINTTLSFLFLQISLNVHGAPHKSFRLGDKNLDLNYVQQLRLRTNYKHDSLLGWKTTNTIDYYYCFSKNVGAEQPHQVESLQKIEIVITN